MVERPIDILKCSFAPHLWHKTPYLECSLELKNDTDIGKYLFPKIAKLEMFGAVVAFATPAFESPGSHGSRVWSATWEGGGISQGSFYWNKETRRTLYCCFEIGAMALNSLAEAFETKGTSTYRMNLEVGVLEEQKMMIQKEPHRPAKQEAMPIPSQGILAYVEGQVKNYQWQEWMKTWGVASEAICLPTSLVSQLRAIKPTMGVGYEWEVISELLKSYQGSKAEAILVTSEAQLQVKMTEVITRAQKELLIMCRALDKTLLGPITEAQDRGVGVKIVTAPTEMLKGEKYREIGRLSEALEKASLKSEVKANAKQHARIIASEQAALVGSTDPDYYGLKIHKNASIYTTNATVVNAAKVFFDKVWQESKAYCPGV